MEQALRIDPENLESKVMLGDFYVQAGRLDDAITHYRNIAAAEPADPAPQFGLAEIQKRRGDVKGAIEALKKAYQLTGEDDGAEALEKAETEKDYERAQGLVAQTRLADLEALAKERYVSPLDLARLQAQVGSGFQDFSAAARYRFGDDTWAIAPQVKYGLPSHNYSYVGEAVVGRNLNELELGVFAALRLVDILPKATVQAGYIYSFVEKASPTGIPFPSRRTEHSRTARPARPLAAHELLAPERRGRVLVRSDGRFRELHKVCVGQRHAQRPGVHGRVDLVLRSQSVTAGPATFNLERPARLADEIHLTSRRGHTAGGLERDRHRDRRSDIRRRLEEGGRGA